MGCENCQHFKIMYEPLKDRGVIWDFGKAKCEKYDLYVDFSNHGKFKRLQCPNRGAEMEIEDESD